MKWNEDFIVDKFAKEDFIVRVESIDEEANLTPSNPNVPPSAIATRIKKNTTSDSLFHKETDNANLWDGALKLLKNNFKISVLKKIIFY